MADAVHVWRVELDAVEWPSASALPSAERVRAERLSGPLARRRWLASRWALRTVLGRYLEEESAALELRLAGNGKPELPDGYGKLRFNLSHSRDLALVAVADRREVGVDVEWIDRRRDVEKLAERALDAVEAATVRAAPAERRATVFHEAWARQEAVVKCHGVGLRAALPATPVAVRQLDAGAGFAAALALAAEAVPPVRLFALATELGHPARLSPHPSRS